MLLCTVRVPHLKMQIWLSGCIDLIQLLDLHTTCICPILGGWAGSTIHDFGDIPCASAWVKGLCNASAGCSGCITAAKAPVLSQAFSYRWSEDDFFQYFSDQRNTRIRKAHYPSMIPKISSIIVLELSIQPCSFFVPKCWTRWCACSTCNYICHFTAIKDDQNPLRLRTKSH